MSDKFRSPSSGILTAEKARHEVLNAKMLRRNCKYVLN
jgi:hypothetical protein